MLSCCLVYWVFHTQEALYAESAGTMELVGLLTDQLGVTENQASGGAGALFKMAKDSLSETDYGKVADAIPGIGSLIQSAPKPSESASGLSEKMAGAKEGLGALSKAAENVNKLGDDKGPVLAAGTGFRYGIQICSDNTAICRHKGRRNGYEPFKRRLAVNF